MDKLSSAGKKLSVAMIARDAETTIAAALDSVRAIADEIIVVDTGSTDRTRHVARQRASKLLEFPWADDFSAARNFALGHLSGDWVLWLDASEQLDRESAEAIRQQLDSRPQPRAYALLVQVPAGPGQVDGEEISQIRLWPIRAGLKFAGRVREQLAPTLAAVGLALETTPWRIARSPRNTSLAIKTEKAKRDLRLAELEIAENSARPPVFTALGDAYATLGQPEQSAAWFRRAIEAAHPRIDRATGSILWMVNYIRRPPPFARRANHHMRKSHGSFSARRPVALRDGQLHAVSRTIGFGGPLVPNGRRAWANQFAGLASYEFGGTCHCVLQPDARSARSHVGGQSDSRSGHCKAS